MACVSVCSREKLKWFKMAERVVEMNKPRIPQIEPQREKKKGKKTQTHMQITGEKVGSSVTHTLYVGEYTHN